MNHLMLCSFLDVILVGLNTYLFSPIQGYTVHKIKIHMFYVTKMFHYVG